MDTWHVSGDGRSALSHSGSKQGAALLSVGSIYFALPGRVLYGAQLDLALVWQGVGHGRLVAEQERRRAGQLRHGEARQDNKPDSSAHTHWPHTQVRVQTHNKELQSSGEATVRPPTRQFPLHCVHVCQGCVYCECDWAAVPDELVLRLSIPLVWIRLLQEVPQW